MFSAMLKTTDLYFGARLPRIRYVTLSISSLFEFLKSSERISVKRSLELVSSSFERYEESSLKVIANYNRFLCRLKIRRKEKECKNYNTNKHEAKNYTDYSGVFFMNHLIYSVTNQGQSKKARKNKNHVQKLRVIRAHIILK